MSKETRVEVINFGDELLIGIRENAHLKYIGEQLAKFGLSVSRNRVIRDNASEIRSAFRDAWDGADLVITTGGLGPTADDLTRESVAEALGAKLVYDASIEDVIRKRFDALNYALTSRHLKQCYRFESGEVIHNERGTAPGLLLEKDGKLLVMLPGPTHELKPMFEGRVIERLQAAGWLKSQQAYLQIRTCGAGESMIEETLQPLRVEHRDLDLAFCVHHGIVDVRLSSIDGCLGHRELQAIGREAHQLLGNDFVCFGECSLAKVVSDELRALDRTLAVAESCTGGLLSDAFTNIPGVSKVFVGGIVCYNNDVKVGMLDVPESLLSQHGAVSAECAIAMATGAAERFSTDYALSITGFAGPDGGNERNPVGTIHIGYHSPVGVWSRTVRYTGGRLDVKARAVITALDWMRRKLRKYKLQEFICDH